MLKLLFVGVGGFLGAVSRYLMSGFVYNLIDKQNFPYGTLAVNIIGCFLIGFLNGVFEVKQVLSPELRLVIFIGFLGGFTTFSTFGYEIFTFMRDNQIVSALLNLFSSVVIGLFAVWLGHILSKLI